MMNAEIQDSKYFMQMRNYKYHEFMINKEERALKNPYNTGCM